VKLFRTGIPFQYRFGDITKFMINAVVVSVGRLFIRR
jgi:hypothetical protein